MRPAATSAPPAPWRARTGHLIGRALISTLYRDEVHGAHRVPTSGPVILAANHTGFLDGPLVFARSPRAGHFLVLAETFDGPLGPLLRFVGQIPISQRLGDRSALGAALSVLNGGGVVGIFPEGGRGRGDLSGARSGVAWLALNSGATVVPVACLGTRYTGELADWWPPLRARMVIDFGKPFDLTPEPGIPGRERLRRAANQVAEGLAAHVRTSVIRHGIPLPTDLPPDVRD